MKSHSEKVKWRAGKRLWNIHGERVRANGKKVWQYHAKPPMAARILRRETATPEPDSVVKKSLTTANPNDRDAEPSTCLPDSPASDECRHGVKKINVCVDCVREKLGDFDMQKPAFPQYLTESARRNAAPPVTGASVMIERELYDNVRHQYGIRLQEIEALRAALRIECPWPESVWPMTENEYMEAVPDAQLRTAISGFLMRRGWQIAVRQIEEAQNKG